MKNMKTAKKLMISFSIVTALALVLTIIGIYSNLSINSNYTYLVDFPFEQEGHLREMKLQFTFLRFRGANFCMEVENPDIITNTLTPQFEEAYTSFTSLLDEYIELNDKDKKHSESVITTTRNNAENLGKLVDSFKQEVDKVRIIALSGNASEATAALRSTIPLAGEINELFDNMILVAADMVHDESHEMSDAAFMYVIMLIIIAILCTIFSFGFATYISGIISKPLRVLEEWYVMTANGDIVFKPEELAILDVYGARKDEVGGLYRAYKKQIDELNETCGDLNMVADGNLDIDVEPRSEYDLFRHSLIKMIDKLNSMFGQINSSTIQVSSGVRQIADDAQNLAQGATQQSATVEELSSSVSEITEQTKSNAEMAEKAADLAGTIKHNAEEGDQHMDDMMSAVKEINEASQQIGKVIKVIDDIAFQTNILALNAAVEAARAGQAGKGFAVVAEEVRNLASKSAEAAKDTAGLIENSMDKAELGTKIAQQTSESLKQIVSGITESSQLVSEIANLSKSQSAGIEQINTGIGQVSQVVQQNSATAEESAAVSEEMSGQSSLLQELVSKFKLKNQRNDF